MNVTKVNRVIFSLVSVFRQNSYLFLNGSRRARRHLFAALGKYHFIRFLRLPPVILCLPFPLSLVWRSESDSESKNQKLDRILKEAKFRGLEEQNDKAHGLYLEALHLLESSEFEFDDDTTNTAESAIDVPVPADTTIPGSNQNEVTLETGQSKAKNDDVKYKLSPDPFYHKRIDYLIYVNDMLANTELELRMLDDAETHFKTTLQLLMNQKGYPPASPEVIDISLKVASIYTSKRKFDDAEMGYKFCIEQAEQAIKAVDQMELKDFMASSDSENPADKNSNESEKFHKDAAKEAKNSELKNRQALLGITLDTYARHLVLNQRLPEATTYLRRALTLAHEVYGAQDFQNSIVIKNNLSKCLAECGDFNEALSIMKTVVDFAEKDESSEVPVYYLNYASILSMSGNAREALSYCKKCYNIASKLQDKNLISRSEECMRICSADDSKDRTRTSSN